MAGESKIRQIYEFRAISGVNKDPGATQHGKFIQWDNNLKTFIYTDVTGDNLVLNSKTTNGIVAKGNDATAGGYVWKLDANKNPGWNKEEYLSTVAKASTGNNAVFTMNSGATKTLPLGSLAWQDYVVADLNLPGDTKILYDGEDLLRGSANFTYNYTNNRLQFINTGLFFKTGTESYQEGVKYLGNYSWSFGNSSTSNSGGSYNITSGYRAGQPLSTNSTKNTISGAFAGESINTDAEGHILIGAYAGRYETGNNKFFLDNKDHSNTADARTNSFLYADLDTERRLYIRDRLAVVKEGKFGYSGLDNDDGEYGMYQMSATSGGVPQWHNGTSWVTFAAGIDNYLTDATYNAGKLYLTSGTGDDPTALGTIEVDISAINVQPQASSPANDYGYIQISNTGIGTNRGFTYNSGFRYNTTNNCLYTPGTVKLTTVSTYLNDGGNIRYDGSHFYGYGKNDLGTAFEWRQLDAPGAGEINDGINVGTGSGLIYKAKDANKKIEFKTLLEDDARVVIANNTSTVDFSLDLAVEGNNLAIASVPDPAGNYGWVYKDTTTSTGINPTLNFKPLICTDGSVVIEDTGDEIKLNAPSGVILSIVNSAPITAVTDGTEVTIGIDPATTTDPGSMSAADKTILDSLQRIYTLSADFNLVGNELQLVPTFTDTNNYTTDVVLTGTDLVTSRDGLTDITTSLAALVGVSDITVGDLLPLFTTNVVNSTSIPEVTYNLVEQEGNLVYASPDGIAGTPSFRSLLLEDLPSIPVTKIDATGIGNDKFLKGDGTWATSTVPIATTSLLGIVKPDGTSITIDLDGTIHAPTAGGGTLVGIGGELPIYIDNTTPTVPVVKIKPAIANTQDGYLTAGDKYKIDNIVTPVNADWNSTTGLSQILNKPSLNFVTSVAAGLGMNFTTITGSGAVTLGTPGTVTYASTNNVYAGGHTHALIDSGASAGNYGNSGVNVPNLTINAKGIITSASNRTIPIATANSLGVVSVGQGLQIDPVTGSLSAINSGGGTTYQLVNSAGQGYGVGGATGTTSTSFVLKTLNGSDHLTVNSNVNGLQLDLEVKDISLNLLGAYPMSLTQDELNSFVFSQKGFRGTGGITVSEDNNSIIINQGTAIPFLGASTNSFVSANQPTLSDGTEGTINFRINFSSDIRTVAATPTNFLSLKIGDGLRYSASTNTLYAVTSGGSSGEDLALREITTNHNANNYVYNLDVRDALGGNSTVHPITVPKYVLAEATYSDNETPAIGGLTVNKSIITWTLGDTQQLTLDEETGDLSITEELVTYGVQNELLDINNSSPINTKRSNARANIGAAYVNGDVTQDFSAKDLNVKESLTADSLVDTHTIGGFTVEDNVLTGSEGSTWKGTSTTGTKIVQSANNIDITVDDYQVGGAVRIKNSTGSTMFLFDIATGNLYVKGKIFADQDIEAFTPDTTI